MSLIGRDDIEHLADLARLRMAPSEVECIADEIEKILQYVSQISEFVEQRATRVSELHDVEAGLRLRKDEADTSTCAKDLGSMAPEFERGFFLVPRLESTGDG